MKIIDDNVILIAFLNRLYAEITRYDLIYVHIVIETDQAVCSEAEI